MNLSVTMTLYQKSNLINYQIPSTRGREKSRRKRKRRRRTRKIRKSTRNTRSTNVKGKKVICWMSCKMIWVSVQMPMMMIEKNHPRKRKKTSKTTKRFKNTCFDPPKINPFKAYITL